MNILLPKIRSQRGNIGNDIWIHLPDLSSFEKTHLSGDEASAQTVLSVLSGTNFSANEYILIGIPGTEQAEIRKVSSADATSITISAALSHSHNQGTPITFIPFNQVEVYSAAGSGGSFSLLSAVDIRADALETYYPRTADASTVYYKARFKHENDVTYSDYSDEVGATGFAYNSVFSVKDRALDQLGETLGGLITDKFLNNSLWEARREFDKQFKRWSFRTSFDSIVGNVVEGEYSISVPSTLRNPDSPQNVLALRIGNRGRGLRYIDKNTFNEYYKQKFHTTVVTKPAVGDTTLVLANTRDFDSSGSIDIGDNNITYTTKDNSTGTLSGIPASGDGSIDFAHVVGTDVWQNISYGEPTQYTMFEDKVWFDTPFSDDFEGTNILMDYYRTLPEYDSDADILDEPDPDMFVSYLKFAIKSKQQHGELKLEKDPDYQNYLIRRNLVIKNEYLHQDIGFSPDIGHLTNID